MSSKPFFLCRFPSNPLRWMHWDLLVSCKLWLWWEWDQAKIEMAKFAMLAPLLWLWWNLISYKSKQWNFWCWRSGSFWNLKNGSNQQNYHNISKFPVGFFSKFFLLFFHHLMILLIADDSSPFSSEHYSYYQHDCPSAKLKDNQVPVCPMCAKPVPAEKGREDIEVSRHIDQFCKTETKIYTNQCTFGKCKKRELVPFKCSSCDKNFCLKHRHFDVHECKGRRTASQSQRDLLAWVGTFQVSKFPQITISKFQSSSSAKATIESRQWKSREKCAGKHERRRSIGKSNRSINERILSAASVSRWRLVE